MTFIERTKQLTAQVLGLGPQADRAAAGAVTEEEKKEYVEEETTKKVSTGTGNHIH